MVFLIIAHPAINQTTHNNIFTLTPSPPPLLPFSPNSTKKIFLKKKNREVDNQREKQGALARGRYMTLQTETCSWGFSSGFSRLY